MDRLESVFFMYFGLGLIFVCELLEFGEYNYVNILKGGGLG